MLFSSQPSDDLLSLVLPALKHRNRFVREAGYGCLTAFLPEEAACEQNGQCSLLTAQRTYACDFKPLFELLPTPV